MHVQGRAVYHDWMCRVMEGKDRHALLAQAGFLRKGLFALKKIRAKCTRRSAIPRSESVRKLLEVLGDGDEEEHEASPSDAAAFAPAAKSAPFASDTLASVPAIKASPSASASSAFAPAVKTSVSVPATKSIPSVALDLASVPAANAAEALKVSAPPGASLSASHAVAPAATAAPFALDSSAPGEGVATDKTSLSSGCPNADAAWDERMDRIVLLEKQLHDLRVLRNTVVDVDAEEDSDERWLERELERLLDFSQEVAPGDAPRRPELCEGELSKLAGVVDGFVIPETSMSNAEDPDSYCFCLLITSCEHCLKPLY
jgi:hypothetical protein